MLGLVVLAALAAKFGLGKGGRRRGVVRFFNLNLFLWVEISYFTDNG